MSKKTMVICTVIVLLAVSVATWCIISMMRKKPEPKPLEEPVANETMLTEDEDVIREDKSQESEQTDATEEEKVDIEEGELERLMRSIAEKTK